MSEESTGAKLGALIVNLALIVPAGLWRAYVAAHLWWWFLVPLGVREPPSLAMLAGCFSLVSLIAGAFFGPSTLPAESLLDKQESLAEKTIAGAAWAFTLPLLCLGTGWIWHALVGAEW